MSRLSKGKSVLSIALAFLLVFSEFVSVYAAAPENSEKTVSEETVISEENGEAEELPAVTETEEKSGSGIDLPIIEIDDSDPAHPHTSMTTHCICGGNIDFTVTCRGAGKNASHETCDASTGWTAVSDWATLKSSALSGGNYYLTQDISADSTINWTEKPVSAVYLNICLNGYTLQQTKDSRLFNMNYSGIHVSICDCGEGGKVKNTSGKTYPYGGYCFNISDSGSSANTTIKIFGGTFSGFNLAPTTTGKQTAMGGVISIGYGSFSMYGGQFVDNRVAVASVKVDTTTYYGLGPAIAIRVTGSGPQMNLYGGIIQGLNRGVTPDVTNRTSSNNGGLIYLVGGTSTIDGGTVCRGNSGSSGGNIILCGKNGTLTMKSGTVSEGYAGTAGGNIFVNAGTFNMEGGSILNGTVKNSCGGNLYFSSTGNTDPNKATAVTANIKGGTISGGKTDISDATKTAYIGGNIAVNNSANALGAVLNVSGSAVITGGQAIRGGNIGAWSGTEINISGGTVSSGTAIRGGNIDTTGNLTMTSGLIEGGKATTTAAHTGGGNIYTGGSGTLTFTGGTVKNGASEKCGGNIMAESNVVIDNSVSKNEIVINGGTAKGYGGNLYLKPASGKTNKIYGAQFINGKNTAGSSGSVSYYGPSSTYVFETENCIFDGGSATSAGGNFGCVEGSGDLRFTNCTFKNGSAKNGGNVAVTVNLKTTFSGCDFIGGTSTEYGGSVYLTSGTHSFTEKTSLDGGKSTKAGGNLFGSATASITVDSSAVKSGEAGTYGGNIYQDEKMSGTFVIRNSSGISSGRAKSGGGNIMAGGSGAKMTLSEVTVSGGRSEASGGNIATWGNQELTITDCEIINGDAKTSGGGLHTTGRVLISGTKLTSNYAGTSGGGIYLGAASKVNEELTAESTTTLTLSGVTMNQNQSKGNGGSLYVTGTAAVTPQVIIKDGTLIQNGSSIVSYGGNLSLAGGTVRIMDAASKITGGATLGGNVVGDVQEARSCMGGNICVMGDATHKATLIIDDGEISGGVTSLQSYVEKDGILLSRGTENGSVGGNINVGSNGKLIATGGVVKNGRASLGGNLAVVGSGEAVIGATEFIGGEAYYCDYLTNSGTVGQAFDPDLTTDRTENIGRGGNAYIATTGYVTIAPGAHFIGGTALNPADEDNDGVYVTSASGTVRITGGYFTSLNIAAVSMTARDIDGADAVSEITGGYFEKLTGKKPVLRGGYFLNTPDADLFYVPEDGKSYCAVSCAAVKDPSYGDSEEFLLTVGEAYRLIIKAKDIAGHEISVIGLSGAGYYEEDATPEISALSETNGYTFVEWRKGDGTKISDAVSFTVSPIKDNEIYYAIYKLGLSKASVKIDVPEGTAYTFNGTPAIGKQTFTELPTDVSYTLNFTGSGFQAWTNENSNVVSMDAAYTFVLTKDETFKAVTADKAGTTVIFLAQGGQVLSSQTLDSGNVETDLIVPDVPVVAGQSGAWALQGTETSYAWSIVSEAIGKGDLTVTFVPEYTADETIPEQTWELYKIVLADQKVTLSVLQEKKGDTPDDTKTYHVGDVITVNAEAPASGEHFLGIYNESGSLISSGAKYCLRPLTKGTNNLRVYYAVYTTEAIPETDEIPYISLANPKLSEQADTRFTFTLAATHNAGDDYVIRERGILFGQNEDALTYESVGSGCMKYTPSTVCQVGTVTLNLKNIPKETTIYAKAYLIYEYQGETVMVYSASKSATGR